MKLMIESTPRIVEIVPTDGRGAVPARIWEGVTESGIPIECLITRIAVPHDEDRRQFEAELIEHRAPSHAWPAFPARLVL